jgi:hypothetical protein
MHAYLCYCLVVFVGFNAAVWIVQACERSRAKGPRVRLIGSRAWMRSDARKRWLEKQKTNGARG